MGTIFKNQNKLRIRLDCGQDISTSTEKKIKYRKPSGIEGEFVATIDADNQTIYYNFSADDIDEAGIWAFWSHITFDDGSVPGEVFKYRVSNEG